MSRLVTSFVVVLTIVVAGVRAEGATVLTANLTNAAETSVVIPTTTGGQPRPVSFGTATFTINDAMTAMTFTATVFNIDFTGSQTADVNDNLVAAHIHASPTVTPAMNATVVWGFFGSPLNDNNPNDVVVTPFVSGVGGTISGKWDAPEGNGGTNLATQLPNILTGHAYINFHTTQFGGGEVRGTLVPEPSSMLLLGIGAAVLVACRRQRSRMSQVD